MGKSNWALGSWCVFVVVVSCGAPSSSESPTPPVSQVELGRQWVDQHGCAGCHQDEGGATLAGASDVVPGSQAYASNLTPDVETGLGRWSDEQIISAVREGVGPGGVTLCAQMPRASSLSQPQGVAMVAYLRSLAPVRHQTPQGACAQPTLVSQGHDVIGRLGCESCHTAKAGPTLGGNPAPLLGGGLYAPNLTSDPDTGLGDWSEAEVIRAVRQGTDDEGATLCAAMPRYAALGDDDAHAMVAYLRSLPQVRQAVPSSTCAERPALLDGGHDAGADAGVASAPPDAGSDAGTDGGVDGGAGWVLVQADVALPPVWVAPLSALSTWSPSLEALAHEATRVAVRDTLLAWDTPCPLPVSAGLVPCNGFTISNGWDEAVVDDDVYLGAATSACAALLPPVFLTQAVGVWDVHFDFASQVTTHVLAATSCADLGLGGSWGSTTTAPPTTDIASQLHPFPQAPTPVTVRGVVIATHLASGRYTFVIEDPQGGRHSGVRVVKKKVVGVPLGVAPAVGAYVEVRGTAVITATGRQELQL
jgi:mono/diheme cytochrome c family protein